MDASLREQIAVRSARLELLATELKAELFGIDAVIDRVIESLRAWYVMPSLITRPVIVCLWGLTGTGKTQLTRLIAQKLGFYDRFVEVQMDGFSNTTGHRSSTISGMLAESSVVEGRPAILVLDEFQRYRTRDADGEDVKVERYQDVWTLLSDGRLAPALSFMSDMEYALGSAQYDREREKNGDTDAPRFKMQLSAYEARELKHALKLGEPLSEIMRWSPEEVQARMQSFSASPESWETDYSKLLIFVSGNLDEMYRHIAQSVEDCDTDADIFHALTQKLSIIDVKKALGKRFKPEQIARLGNNHVIYPSFNRATYMRLIAHACDGYVRDIAALSHLHFDIEEAVRAEIYANAVFPSQGTRPLFSSVHALLSAVLVDATLWALAHGALAGDRLCMTLAQEKGHLWVQWKGERRAYSVEFELNSYTSLRSESRRNMLDMICVSLSGRAAEAMVFGESACTTGAEQDFKQATAAAAQWVRHHGFGDRISRTDVTHDQNDDVNTDVAPTNAAIEALLQAQYARAVDLLRLHATVFVRITEALVQQGEVPPQQLADWMGLKATKEQGVLEPYAQRLAAFALQQRRVNAVTAQGASTVGRVLASASG